MDGRPHSHQFWWFNATLWCSLWALTAFVDLMWWRDRSNPDSAIANHWILYDESYWTQALRWHEVCNKHQRSKYHHNLIRCKHLRCTIASGVSYDLITCSNLVPATECTTNPKSTYHWPTASKPTVGTKSRSTCTLDGKCLPNTTTRVQLSW